VKVIGLDLSLTCAGVAVATQDGAVTDRITSKPVPAASLADRTSRIDQLVDRVMEHATGADLVIIEGPSLGQQRQGGTHDRAGFWWLVAWRLWVRGYTVVEVPPATRTRYATGRGNASKDDVLSAVIRRYPHVDVNGNDEADALILAAMGARFLGHPLERPVPGRPLFPGSPLPKTCLAAMDAVTWPEHLGGAA
jgi:crossover junction endodeoxyribonuclease RuvC